MLVGTSRGHLPFLTEAGPILKLHQVAQVLSVLNISTDRDSTTLGACFHVWLPSQWIFFLPSNLLWCSPCPRPLALLLCTTVFQGVPSLVEDNSSFHLSLLQAEQTQLFFCWDDMGHPYFMTREPTYMLNCSSELPACFSCCYSSEAAAAPHSSPSLPSTLPWTPP